MQRLQHVGRKERNEGQHEGCLRRDPENFQGREDLIHGRGELSGEGISVNMLGVNVELAEGRERCCDGSELVDGKPSSDVDFENAERREREHPMRYALLDAASDAQPLQRCIVSGELLQQRGHGYTPALNRWCGLLVNEEVRIFGIAHVDINVAHRFGDAPAGGRRTPCICEVHLTKVWEYDEWIQRGRYAGGLGGLLDVLHTRSIPPEPRERDLIHIETRHLLEHLRMMRVSPATYDPETD